MKIARAMGARLIFTVHSILTIWQATEVRDNQAYWSFALISVAIILEGFYTIMARAGDERKWSVQTLSTRSSLQQRIPKVTKVVKNISSYTKPL